jgi:hypothetical protein
MKKDEVRAVEMVRKIRDEQFEALKGKGGQERREYYHREAAALHRKLGVKEKSKRS